MSKLLALLLLVPAISWGAVIQNTVTAVPTETKNVVKADLEADLRAALATAQEAHDPMAPVRAKCYQTLLGHLSTLSAPAAPVGPISAFERAAELAEGADAGVPLDIRVDCAPVALRARDILLKFGLTIKAGTILLP